MGDAYFAGSILFWVFFILLVLHRLTFFGLYYLFILLFGSYTQLIIIAKAIFYRIDS